MPKIINTLRPFLLPFSLVYGLVVCLRNKFYDWGIFSSQSFAIPVICVGNITVGGTGKTPHVEYLVGEYKDSCKLAVLSRGYGRKTKGFRYVAVTNTASEVGDEPLQMKQKFPEITFAVDEKRARGIWQLQSEGYEMVILDDAFQHRAVQPSKTIVLLDYNRLPHKDYYLPSGNLREGRYALRRADIVLITKCPVAVTEKERARIIRKNKVKVPCFFTHFEYGKLHSFKEEEIAEDLKGKTVLLVTGIANPEPLVNYIKEKGAKLQILNYPDHYDFKEKDLHDVLRKFDKIVCNNKIVLTTEKDKVKLLPLLPADQNIFSIFHYIPVRVVFQGKKMVL